MSRLHIEAVTVSVNCADFLHETARHNRGLFDRWLIVTTEEDVETREVCRKYNLEVVLTKDFTRDGPDDFAKARGINRGLYQLSASCWHLHLDADIILPPTLHQLLEAAHLDSRKIYGFDRVMIQGWEQYQDFLKSNHLWHDYHFRVQAPPYPLGTRWVSPQHGWVPIGYAQLWHTDSEEWHGIKQRRYPDRHGDAARCDVQFGLLWDRQDRILLPEVIAVHLESEPSKMGMNWNGRVSKRFGPPGGILKTSSERTYCR